MKYALTLLLLFACGIAQADITSNLIYHWKFDNDLTEEVAGNTMTVSAGTAAYSTSPLPFSGSGTTHSLDITSDTFVSTSACTGISGAYTIAFWYKRGTSNNNTFTLESGSVVVQDTANIIRYIFASGAFIDSTTNTSIDGDWLHIAATCDGVNRNGVTLYINGTAEATGSGIGGVAMPNDALSFPGSTKTIKVDDFRIYSRELSSGDVTELYNYTGASSGSPLLRVLLESQ